MSGRPVRRRVLAAVAQRGGWSAVLQRIENGETVKQIASSFDVSPSFFAHLLHEDRERHELVMHARNVPIRQVANSRIPHLPTSAFVEPGEDRRQRHAATWQIAREVPGCLAAVLDQIEEPKSQGGNRE